MSTTAALMILLTNSSSQTLTLQSCEVTGSSSAKTLDLPKTLERGTYGGLGLPASDTPYSAKWVYSPDGGATLLTFRTSLDGPRGLSVWPSESGKDAVIWQLAEGPDLTSDGWVIRYYYSLKS